MYQALQSAHDGYVVYYCSVKCAHANDIFDGAAEWVSEYPDGEECFKCSAVINQEDEKKGGLI